MGNSGEESVHLPPGVHVRDLPQHDDDRGFLVELTSTTVGDGARAAQWNVLHSTANTLRGMHVHVRHTDWITVVAGEAVFGLVDLRSGTIDDAARATVSMRAESLQVLTIPPGVLHGIYTPVASVVLNGLSHEFDAGDDLAVRYDDPSLGLDWTMEDPVLSARDRGAPTVTELLERLAADGVAWPTPDA
jgi:dTDP-4-dehydrorhamnose 3,5-epimerase